MQPPIFRGSRGTDNESDANKLTDNRGVRTTGIKAYSHRHIPLPY